MRLRRRVAVQRLEPAPRRGGFEAETGAGVKVRTRSLYSSGLHGFICIVCSVRAVSCASTQASNWSIISPVFLRERFLFWLCPWVHEYRVLGDTVVLVPFSSEVRSFGALVVPITTDASLFLERLPFIRRDDCVPNRDPPALMVLLNRFKSPFFPSLCC